MTKRRVVILVDQCICFHSILFFFVLNSTLAPRSTKILIALNDSTVVTNIQHSSTPSTSTIMGSLLSIEALFWVPLGMDLMLLVGTYSAFKLSGLKWYLEEMKKHSEQKKNDDDDEVIAKLVDNNSHPIHSVWELAMIAYSAYGCLLPWATYVCYNHPSLRVSLSWAMTILMTAKLASPNTWKWTNVNGQKGKTMTIIFFYIPTYGGYAAYKSFFSS